MIQSSCFLARVRYYLQYIVCTVALESYTWSRELARQLLVMGDGRFPCVCVCVGCFLPIYSGRQVRWMYVCMYVWSSHIAEYGSTG